MEPHHGKAPGTKERLTEAISTGFEYLATSGRRCFAAQAALLLTEILTIKVITNTMASLNGRNREEIPYQIMDILYLFSNLIVTCLAADHLKTLRERTLKSNTPPQV